MSEELPKTYQPEEMEKKWYQRWEQGHYFKPRQGKQQKAFSLVMPPPNVTGILHVGHALDITTQDTLVRYKRMKGFETLFLPGLDHAGIATQSVVEKQVYQTEKKTKHDFSREEFLQKIWQWKEEKGGAILGQQRTMGASPDWDYLMFTMDPTANAAVRKVFVDLYHQGLIYQADYIVNWDPILQSAISDAEVVHQEISGHFYHLLYPLADGSGNLEIATTRPETMLADTAVAVHPLDPRYQHLIGKMARVPLTEREVPIIGDEHVDPSTGTGVLKVTPGHDFNDFGIGQRHQLPIINMLNADGTCNHHAGKWQGLACQKARSLIVEELKSLGLLVKIIAHQQQVGHGDRTGAIIEPMVSKQWFVDVQAMSKEAVAAVKENKTIFWPQQWENTYFSWLQEPKNWCISRQLWWGHQIPYFTCPDCGHGWATVETPEYCPECFCRRFQQDPDVLDTWFSSGLWALSTLGWPDPKLMAERGFSKFFPTSCLITGYDIIFFWVARMMMLTLKFTQQIPFQHVYIHAIVRDKFGKKMSKSSGNGIDPLAMIEQYGADALRFCLAAGSGYNRNLNLDPDKIAIYRNFINKVWNAFRFLHPFLAQQSSAMSGTYPTQLDHHERWILAELNSVTKKVNESLDEYRFDDACSAIYTFVYDKFCSWFLELSKPLLYGAELSLKTQRVQVLHFAFRQIVALLHPFIPFITEELWQSLKTSTEDLLIIQDFPEYQPQLAFPDDQTLMNQFIETIIQIRNLRAQVQIKPKESIIVMVFSDDPALLRYYQENGKYFAELAQVKQLVSGSKSDLRPPKSLMLASYHTEVFIPLEGLIDIDTYISKLQKELDKIKKEWEKLQQKLNNPNFQQQAKSEVIAEVNERAQQLSAQAQSLAANISTLKT